MKIILVVLINFFILTSYVMQKGSDLEVYVHLEKLKAKRQFRFVNDSISYQNICFSKDSCFSIVSVVLLDSVGSYAMTCKRNNENLIFHYKGLPEWYRVFKWNSFDLEGNVIGMDSAKIFIPRLIKVERCRP